MNERNVIKIGESLRTGELLCFSFGGCATIMEELRRADFLLQNGVNLGLEPRDIAFVRRRFDIWSNDCLKDIAIGADDYADDIVVQLTPSQLECVDSVLRLSYAEALKVAACSDVSTEQQKTRLGNLEIAIAEAEANDWRLGFLKRVRVFSQSS